MAEFVRRLWDETMAEEEARERGAAPSEAGRPRGEGGGTPPPKEQSAWAAKHPISAAACVADAVELRALLGATPPPGRETLDALDGEGRAALHYAASNGLPEPVAALVSAGATVDVRTGDRRSTPLHLACGMNHAAVARALLRAGAQPDARDVVEWTPLDLAKQDLFSRPEAVAEVVRVLAAHAADGCGGGALKV